MTLIIAIISPYSKFEFRKKYLFEGEEFERVMITFQRDNSQTQAISFSTDAEQIERNVSLPLFVLHNIKEKTSLFVFKSSGWLLDAFYSVVPSRI